MAISIDRVLEKLDSYFAKNDYAAAERHLSYWKAEAKLANDDRANFFITNEQIGYYRKQGKKDLALQYVHEILLLIDTMQMENTISAATAYLNSATAYKAFAMAEKAMPLFQKAQKIYEQNLPKDDARLAGLYNNMALALCDLKQFEKAKGYYQKALAIMQQQEDILDAAITYLNLADALYQEKGATEAEAEINALMEKAKSILEQCKEKSDGYYAFVCEKCASTFGYYGYFAYKNELLERAGKIYAGN